jgi:VWFA-related protein
MKKITSLFFLSLLVLVSPSARAQKPQPSPQQTVKPADESDVVRITTNLIQVDAVVTDKNGKVVTNLRPEDFEIVVNGKSQQITNFSFVTVQPQPIEQPVVASKNIDKNAPPIPPVRLRPDQVNRTIALVVDDLTLSFVSTNYVRKALEKFVDEQMQPGDLVAIVRVGSGIGALQQFTSDKQQLHSAIERMKYNPMVGRMDAFAPLGSEGAFKGSDTSEQAKGIVNGEDVEKLREDILISASLAATNYVVRGMRGLPGRKAVMFLSEGFPLVDPGQPEYAFRIREAIKRLVDSANRSGVVIYTMDARGLQTLGLNANDDVNRNPTALSEMTGARTTMNGQQIQAVLEGRRLLLLDTQDGLRNLAEQAGGFAVYNTNDLPGGIRKALDDQKSYYLIGYQPDASTFEATKGRFNQLRVKVKDAGLKVRYRSGFFGIKDEDIKPVASTPQQQIMSALSSPFGASDISLRLTPLFGNDARAGSFVRSLVHISTKNLTFTDKPDGSHEAVINVVAYTFGDNGRVVDSVGETHTISLADKLYQRALASGFVYSLNVPVKETGAYQLRVAVRDDKSEKVGTASQFITIPDIKRGRLSLSGIALSSYDPREGKNRTNDAVQQSTEDASVNTALTQAALRRFRTGHVLQFGYAIYNATLGKQTRQPQLTTQIKLYRDGQEIYAGKEMPYSTNGQLDVERLVAEGALQLGGLQVGEYVLQVNATDALAQGKNRKTTGWIDFEVVK